MSDSAERVAKSTRTTLLGLAVNMVLAVTKLTAGLVGHSYALVADAIESFADLASSIIVWHGVRVAGRPADADHPYGHGRAETVATAAVAVMLILAAITIALESVHSMRSTSGVPASFTLVVLLGVVLVKEGLFRFVSQVGREIESSAVGADAWHHRSDAITSAAAALGITVALVGGRRFESADEWAAIFAACIIALNGVRLLRPALTELMETEPAGDISGQARAIALRVPGVRGVEKCFARQLGYEFRIDMHLEVDGTTTVTAAHEIAHVVKDAIRGALPRVIDVAIHIEPARR
jgi:cation diffusion facilitator family transporter